MVINKDVEFNEEGEWDWKVNDVEKYDFLSILNEEEERYEDHQEPIVTHLQTPMSSTSFSSSSESSSSGTPLSPLRKMRSLDDLYKVTYPIDNDITVIPYLPWHIKSINHSNMTHLGKFFLFIEKIHLDTLSYLQFHVEGVYQNFGRVSFVFITYQVID
jgi:hypothetical protein